MHRHRPSACTGVSLLKNLGTYPRPQLPPRQRGVLSRSELPVPEGFKLGPLMSKTLAESPWKVLGSGKCHTQSGEWPDGEALAPGTPCAWPTSAWMLPEGRALGSGELAGGLAGPGLAGVPGEHSHAQAAVNGLLCSSRATNPAHLAGQKCPCWQARAQLAAAGSHTWLGCGAALPGTGARPGG